DREHMVCPYAQADEGDDDRGRDHYRVSKNRLPRKYRYDFRHESKARNDQDVNFRMTENPEEVHPENGRSAGLRIEKVSSEISINQEHDLCGRKRSDNDQDHS